MATEAQILANQLNAQSSTGARTPEGKARTSRNAVKLGLFSLKDLVRPEEEAEYHALTTALWHDLLPDGALQQSIAVRIIRATWRLERCARVEESLFDGMLETGLDPMQNEAQSKIQTSVDRARASAEATIRRATIELRRLQTDRQIMVETFPKEAKQNKTPHLGLTSMKEVLVSIKNQNNAKLLIRKVQGNDAVAEAMTLEPGLMELLDEVFPLGTKPSQKVAA